jgi:steroid 5-alpha reductase family enzyme
MLTQIWIAAAITALALFHLVFIPAAILKKNDFADILWGPVFPLTALAALWQRQFLTGNDFFDPPSALLFCLLLVWAVRLAYHVGKRNLAPPLKEDPRYHSWRKNWGNQQALWSYLKVYLLQSLIMLLIASPIIWVIAFPAESLNKFALAGLLIWLVGFHFELVADRQLKTFGLNPQNKGKLLTTGLWGWSRHPNYFGEAAMWWGIFLFALPLPFGWITVISPVMITFLLLKVSGVPMLEVIMEKKPGWAEYKARVPVFFPRPPIKK